MADIQDGFSMTLKRGADLFVVQGTTYAKFRANLEEFFGAESADAVEDAFRPVSFEQAKAMLGEEAEKKPAAPKPAPKAGGGRQVTKNPDDPATENQRNFIWNLAKTAGMDRAELLEIASQVKGEPVSALDQLTKRDASAVIDAIKGK